MDGAGRSTVGIMAVNKANLIAWEPEDDTVPSASVVSAPVTAPKPVSQDEERRQDDDEIVQSRNVIAQRDISSAEVDEAFVPPNLPVVDDSVVAKAVLASVPAVQATEPATGGDADLDALQAAMAKRNVVSAQSDALVNALTAPSRSPLDEAVDQAVSECGISMSDPEMQKRFQLLVQLYFRDLRDRLETLSKLTMPIASGGVGMTDSEAEGAMKTLSQKNLLFHAVGLAHVKEGKEQYVAARVADTTAREELTVKKDTDSQDRAFERATGRSIPIPPRLLVPPKAILVTAVAKDMESVVVKSVIEPVVAPIVVPVPISANMPSQSVFQKPPNAVTPAPTIPAVKPTLDVPKSSVPTAPPIPVQKVVPSMSDVSGAPQRLTGPVEELRSTTLVDFRRLSRDPREALLKLRDKIDLLAEQSFEMKTRGIKAWQESEVQKTYLDILKASLEGIPVGDVIAKRTETNVPTLTKEEFDAVRVFNREVRFGS